MPVQNERIRLEWGPAANTAGGTPDVWYCRVPGPTGAKYKIESAHLMPHNAITANGTNFATMTLRNETTSTDIASRSHAATNSVAGTAEALTVAAAATEITAGDVLSWTKAETASGMAIHNTVIVEATRIR